MSHRFTLRPEQIQWVRDNIPKDLFYFPGNGYVDIMTDEDAAMFILTFGTKRHSTKIQRMIEREAILERLAERRLNGN